jgi:hypothetical protein
MRKYAFLSAIMIVLAATSCKNEDVQTDQKLEVSKSAQVKLGEQITIISRDSKVNPVQAWDITPSTYQTKASSDSAIVVSFQKAGTYVISAVSKQATYSAQVSVKDSVYVPTDNPKPLAPLTGDLISIKPLSVLDSANYSSLLVEATTKNQYDNLNNYLDFTNGFDGSTLTVEFNGVASPETVVSGKSNAKAIIYLGLLSSNGTYNLVIMLNSVKYTGTLTKNNNQYSINWSYTAGVVFTSTTLTKQ